MNIYSPEVQLIANALSEIRSLLSSYLGAENDVPSEIRLAAHIAYALHNEAAGLVDGNGFDVKAALRKVMAIDNILQGTDGHRLAAAWAIESCPKPVG